MKLLLLLIGDNNISNYALVKFLEKKGFSFDNIGVIYTKKTKNNVENLKKLLHYNFLEIDVEDVKEDYLKVKEVIENNLKNYTFEKVFLDYTGGLKSMSLGAFLAVNKLQIDEKDKYISYVFSNEIIFKRGDRYKLNESLSIEEIAGVHGVFDLESKKENSEFFSLENVFWLLDQIENNEKEFFSIWDNKEVKKINWQDSLKNSPFNLENISNNKLKKLQKYIRGDFLEEYIFYALNEIKEEAKIFEIAWNVREGKNSKVEVDVIATKNNNLYLFSCTTDKKKYVKQKGFEAKERATQYGGKNAKAILVSCIDESQKELVLEDLKEKKGGTPPNVIVLQELKNYEMLKQKLKEVFNV